MTSYRRSWTSPAVRIPVRSPISRRSTRDGPRRANSPRSDHLCKYDRASWHRRTLSSSSETSQTDGCLPCRPRFRLRPHVDSRRQIEGLRLNPHRRQHPVSVSYLRRCDGLARDTFSQCKSTARSCLSLVILFFGLSDLFALDSSRPLRTRTSCSIQRPFVIFSVSSYASWGCVSLY